MADRGPPAGARVAGRNAARLDVAIHPGDALEFDLVPAGADRFNPGLYRGGELFNVEMALGFEFEGDPRAMSVVMRGIEGTPFATGVRELETAGQR